MALLTSRLARWSIFAVIVVLLAAAGTIAFRRVGQWLIVDDPLHHADVIVVLSGELPDRAIAAARIYTGGYAAQVWISQGASPSDEFKKMNIAYLGEDFYNEKILLAQGVPLDAITIMETPIVNTEQEVREIAAAMRRENMQTAIVVTSQAHTRRVRAIWQKLAPPDLHLVMRFDNENYDGAHWWRHTREALDVSREVFGLINAWAGFPVRPSQN